MSTIKQIKTAIFNKLSGMSTLNGVYNFTTGKPTGYPFAIVINNSGTTQFGTAIGNGGGYNTQRDNFSIIIYQEREQGFFGAQKAERVTLEILDELITTLNTDTVLGGAVLWSKIRSYFTGYETEQTLARTITLEFETVSIVTLAVDGIGDNILLESGFEILLEDMNNLLLEA